MKQNLYGINQTIFIVCLYHQDRALLKTKQTNFKNKKNDFGLSIDFVTTLP